PCCRGAHRSTPSAGWSAPSRRQWTAACCGTARTRSDLARGPSDHRSLGRQLDDDVAMPIQRGPRARRHHARRIVLFDDAGTDSVGGPRKVPHPPPHTVHPPGTRGPPRTPNLTVQGHLLAHTEGRGQVNLAPTTLLTP